MPTDVEQVVIEYTTARNIVRDLIRSNNGKGLDIEPALIRRIRDAEAAILAMGERLMSPADTK